MSPKLERLRLDQRQGSKHLLHGIAREIVHADDPYQVRDLVEAIKQLASGRHPEAQTSSEPPRRPEPEEPTHPPDPDEDEDEDEDEHHPHTKRKVHHRKR